MTREYKIRKVIVTLINYIKYNSYTIDKEKFIEECKTGLLYSLVRIYDKIYELSVDSGTMINNDKYDGFRCYINDVEIVGLDNFLNYKFDNIHCLNELNTIEFLEYNNNDPKEYFVNNTL